MPLQVHGPKVFLRARSLIPQPRFIEDRFHSALPAPISSTAATRRFFNGARSESTAQRSFIFATFRKTHRAATTDCCWQAVCAPRLPRIKRRIDPISPCRWFIVETLSPFLRCVAPP
jgi:hypothetical protein